MLKGRHRYGAGASSRAAPRRSVIAPPEVGIVPGNRFLLLPLKKVSALVRHHDYPCRGASATSTKTCIESKAPPTRVPTPATHPARAVRSPSTRSRPRRRHPPIAKTRLGPISEQDEGTTALLNDPGNNAPCNHAPAHVARIRKQNLERAENARRISTYLYFRKAGKQDDPAHPSAPQPNPPSHPRRRAKGTSIFSLDQPEQRRARLSAERAFVSELVETALQQEGMGAGPRRRKKGAFGRNRVSPSEHVVPSEAVLFSEQSFVAGSSVRVGRSEGVGRRVRSGDESFGGDLPWWRGGGCSLGDGDDLPIGPLRGSTLRELLLK